MRRIESEGGTIEPGCRGAYKVRLLLRSPRPPQKSGMDRQRTGDACKCILVPPHQLRKDF